MYSLVQDRVRTFELGVLPFKNFIAGAQVKAFTEMNEHFIDAARTLGVGELYARRHERESRLKSLENEAKGSKALFIKHNQLGMQRLADTSQKLKEAVKELGAHFGQKDLKSILPRINAQVDEFKFQCVELEIKGKDVDKLYTAVDSLVSSLQKGGLKGIADLLDCKLTELATVRKSENRGAIDNFPVWKMIALVFFLGAWIIAVIHCTLFGCTTTAGASYSIIMAIAAIVTTMC
jgi:hypothetical protein